DTPRPDTTAGRTRDLRTIQRELRGDLDWIVMKCLEKDRSRRYDTANGLAADLKRHLDNEPVTARPPSTIYKFQKALRPNKLAFAATAAIILVLAAGIVVSTWQAARAWKAEAEQNRLRAAAQAAQESEATQKTTAQEALYKSLVAQALPIRMVRRI